MLSFYTLGTSCLYNGLVIASPSVNRINNTHYIISAGLREDIEPDVLTSVQCDITLECLNCSSNELEANVDKCISIISFNEIPIGYYNVSISSVISTLCGEVFMPPSAYYTHVGE